MKKSRWLIAGVGLAAFLIITYFVMTGRELAFDTVIREAFYSARSEGLNSVVTVLTHIGDTRSIVILCLILLILPQTRKAYGLPVSMGAIAASSLNHFLKSIFQRPRPDVSLHLIDQGGWSFPSGHSITSMVVFGLLIWLVRRNVKNKKAANVLTVLLAIPWLGIGLSRIYVGVHYPTDVLGGWCLGLVILMLMIFVAEKLAEASDS